MTLSTRFRRIPPVSGQMMTQPFVITLIWRTTLLSGCLTNLEVRDVVLGRVEPEQHHFLWVCDPSIIGRSAVAAVVVCTITAR